MESYLPALSTLRTAKTTLRCYRPFLSNWLTRCESSTDRSRQSTPFAVPTLRFLAEVLLLPLTWRLVDNIAMCFFGWGKIRWGELLTRTPHIWNNLSIDHCQLENINLSANNETISLRLFRLIILYHKIVWGESKGLRNLICPAYTLHLIVWLFLPLRDSSHDHNLNKVLIAKYK